MNKLWEKRNLGIPVTLLVLIAYFIGYSFAFNLYNLLIAILFGVFVFALDFDDRIKTAVKQSYTISLLFCLANFIVTFLNSIYGIFNSGQNFYYDSSNMDKAFSFKKLLYNIYGFSNNFLNIAAVIVFGVLIIAVLMKKDIKVNFILNIIGEGTPKQPKRPKQPKPVYPQGSMMYQQPTMPQHQIPPAGMQPNTSAFCPICGAAVKPHAAFCGNCGNKLK